MLRRKDFFFCTCKQKNSCFIRSNIETTVKKIIRVESPSVVPPWATTRAEKLQVSVFLPNDLSWMIGMQGSKPFPIRAVGLSSLAITG